jgi:thioredoxin 1
MNSKESHVTLIDFYTTWCSPCQTMDPIIERIENDFTDTIQLLKVDVDENRKLAQLFKIQNVPTFILLKNKDIVWKQAGIMTYRELKKKILENL